MTTKLTTKQDITTRTDLWTSEDVKRYFDPNDLLNMKQVGQALALIKGRNLNPFSNEVYIVAYRKKNGQTEFNLIVSKEAFLKRAALNKNYEGFEAGTVVLDENGILVERKGSLILPSDDLVGGWARVFRKDFKVPVESFVSRQEYDKKQSTWLSMPATMIRKTALVNALREAFPEDLGNMYTDVDGSETFAKDVTPEEHQETKEDVIERKKAEIEKMRQEADEKLKANTEDIVEEQTEQKQVDLLEQEILNY